jgi:hypothetical protein
LFEKKPLETAVGLHLSMSTLKVKQNPKGVFWLKLNTLLGFIKMSLKMAYQKWATIE